MTITKNTVPADAKHPAFNEVLWKVTSDRYDATTNAATILSVADQGGYCRYTASATHGFSVGDIMIGSGFDPQVTYNVVQVITNISAVNVFDTGVAFVGDDTGTITRRNNNFKMQLEIKDGSDVIATMFATAEDTDKFAFDIQHVLQAHILSNTNEGTDVVTLGGTNTIISPATQNGVFDYNLEFTDIFDDENDTSKDGSVLAVTLIEDRNMIAYNIVMQEGEIFDTDTFTDYASQNLNTNGSFALDASWTKGTGWTIDGGAAKKAAGTASDLYQDFTMANATKYLVIFEISGRTAGTVAAYCGNTGAGTSRSTNATFTEEITNAGTPADRFYLKADSSFDGDITFVAVYEIAALKFLTKMPTLNLKADEELQLSFITEHPTAKYYYERWSDVAKIGDYTSGAVTINNKRGIAVINDNNFSNATTYIKIRIISAVGNNLTEILTITRDTVTTRGELRVEWKNLLGGLDSYSFREAEIRLKTKQKLIEISDIWKALSIDPNKSVVLTGKSETASMIEWLADLYTSKVLWLVDISTDTRIRVAILSKSYITETRDLKQPRIELRLTEPKLN